MSATVPWAIITTNPGFYFKIEDEFPQDVQLKEPSRYRLIELRRILKHWQSRKRKGLDPIEFVRAVERDMIMAQEGEPSQKRRRPKQSQKKYVEVGDAGGTTGEEGNNKPLGDADEEEDDSGAMDIDNLDAIRAVPDM